MEVFLDTGSRLTVKTTTNLSDEEYNQLEKLSMDFAYDTFLELKEKQLQKNLKSYNKYMYALKLRTEAAENIGIENIRTSRLLKLEKEKAAIESEFQKGKQVYPDFRLTLLVRLEA
jgi:superfamily II RNA helicase